jgi:transcriptional regulator with XRE-family HTH domain
MANKITIEENTFGIRFKKLRYQMGREYTLDKVARDLDVHPTTVWSWENKNKLPRKKLLLKIAEYFGVSIDYLFGREERIQEERQKEDVRKLMGMINALSNPSIKTLLREVTDYLNQDMKDELNEIINFIRFRKMSKTGYFGSPQPSM